MKLSIVTTLYCSANHISDFYQRATAAAKELVGEDFELVFVNDGSPDNSIELAIEISRQDQHVVVVDLSRNFGHHKAMMTGLSYARGDKVFLIDSDLEESPEWLLSFDEQLEKEKCDVVYGVQESRKGSLFERLTGSFYYWVLDRTINIDHPKNITTARLMKKPYVESLMLYREREIVMSGLWVLTGYIQNQQFVQKESTSATTYSLVHKLAHLVNVVTSFSSKPLMSIFFTGSLIFSGSVMYALFLIINRLFFSIPVDGWTSIMVSIWLLGGLIILFVGVIGIYLSKVFIETKQRPISIVKNIYGLKRPE